MPTDKKRIYVTLPQDTEHALYALAQRDATAPATKAAELIKLALEIFEDDMLEKIASARDRQKTDVLSHEEAWQ